MYNISAGQQSVVDRGDDLNQTNCYHETVIASNFFRFKRLCWFFVLVSGISVAQVLPPPVEPRPIKPIERPEFPKEKIPEVKVEPMGDEAPPGATKIFTVLRDMVIEDVTVYEKNYLRTFYEQFIGQKLALHKFL